VMSKRERWMLFGTGLLAIVGLYDTFMLEPIRQQTAVTTGDRIRMQEDIAKTKALIATASTQVSVVKSPVQSEIERLNQAITDQKKSLVDVTNIMVGADEMLPLLKDMLKKHDSIQLVKFESLPPQSFVKNHLQQVETSSVEAPQISSEISGLDDIFQHTISLTIKGSYLAVLSYAEDLKSQHEKLAWENAELKADFPVVELTIHLYTLSMQKAWLGI
jgi:MSHA biogenesis protein MshJ